MAKATNVNIDCSTRQGSQLLFELKVLLLANGWTITATSDGTNFTNGASPDNVSTVALFDVSNAYYVLADPSGTCWVYIQRRAANTTFTVKVSRVAPQTNGTATALPTCATATNEITLINNATLFNSSGSARGHIITYDASENAAGVRPFYALMTDGTATLRGSLVVEAIADNTYDPLNLYPWVTAAGAGDAGLDSSGTPCKYYYSPTNVFVSINWSYYYNNSNIATNWTNLPSPWGSGDTALPAFIGTGTTSPANVLGFFKNIQIPSYYRGYPNTFTTNAGERYVHARYFIIPYANGVQPI
jgi:hypothetical protein